MRTRKPAVTAVCMLLCMLMLVGLAASSFAEEALAELHVEKNGLTLDLSLLKLEIEDGKLVVSVGIDGITKWKDEEPPKIILDFEQAGEKFTSLWQSFRKTPKTTRQLPSIPSAGRSFPTGS